MNITQINNSNINFNALKYIKISSKNTPQQLEVLKAFEKSPEMDEFCKKYDVEAVFEEVDSGINNNETYSFLRLYYSFNKEAENGKKATVRNSMFYQGIASASEQGASAIALKNVIDNANNLTSINFKTSFSSLTRSHAQPEDYLLAQKLQINHNFNPDLRSEVVSKIVQKMGDKNTRVVIQE